MKKITGYLVQSPDVNSVRQKEKCFSVFVNWKLKYYYSSKKEAEGFQNRLFSWINDCVVNLNECYIDCFAAYRRLWLFYDTDMQDGRKIDILFNEIEKCFDMLHSRVLLPGSGIVTVNKFMLIICNNMLEVYKLMSEKQAKRNNYEALKLYQFRASVLQRIVYDLENIDQVIDRGRALFLD